MEKVRIIVLGAPRSGKTCYLTGLYHFLSVESADYPTILETDPASDRLLRRQYRQIIRPDLQFPERTDWGVRKWSFDCIATSTHGTYPLFSLEYIDYAGEMINADELDKEKMAGDPSLQEFDDLRKKADVFVVIIDGDHLYRLLRGDTEPEITGWLDDYLPAQLTALPRPDPDADSDLRPVHFVITKWDVLAAAQYTLDDAREVLLSQRQLRGYVEARRQRRGVAVRLIPVSVTGAFLRRTGDGKMTKVPDNPVCPLNLDVPFAAILPDLITQIEGEASVANKARALSQSHWRRRIYGALKTGGRLTATGVVRQAVEVARRYLTVQEQGKQSQRREQATWALMEAIGPLVADYAESKLELIDANMGELLERRRIAQLQADNRQKAMRAAVDSFQARLAEFELDYPSSLLAGNSISGESSSV